MSSFFTPTHEPTTKLGHYRVLSPLASVHVSPIQLGAASIGDQWADKGWGAMDKDTSFALLDAYYEMGGNFIDTASNYQDESSERFIGEWAEARGIRDQLVIATKYTTNYKMGNKDVKIQANYTGNSHKSMYVSVNASLAKLRTTYIDILYVHWWDFDTSVEEVMNNLHNLVVQGKVLYLGISDTPAWIVSKANQYARDHGKTPFVVYQGLWNVMVRDFEREILPMCRSEGLALAPWGVVGQGKFLTDAEEQRRRETGEKGRAMVRTWERNETEKKMSAALEKVAKEVGAEHITAVATAYVMQKAPYVFPILGGRKIEHLKGNLAALDISLSPEQIKYLEEAVSFEHGFPTNFIGNQTMEPPLPLKNSAGRFEKVEVIQAIKHSKD